MEKEFRALGVDARRRGAITDATLAFLHACFAGDEVEANGQRFLFRPRPARPPIIVGGAPPHAIDRAVRFGDGWMPTGAHAQMLEAGIASLREGMAAAGKPAPEVVLLQPLPVEDDARTRVPSRRARRAGRDPCRPSLALPGCRGGRTRRRAPGCCPRCPRPSGVTEAPLSPDPDAVPDPLRAASASPLEPLLFPGVWASVLCLCTPDGMQSEIPQREMGRAARS